MSAPLAFASRDDGCAPRCRSTSARAFQKRFFQRLFVVRIGRIDPSGPSTRLLAACQMSAMGRFRPLALGPIADVCPFGPGAKGRTPKSAWLDPDLGPSSRTVSDATWVR